MIVIYVAGFLCIASLVVVLYSLYSSLTTEIVALKNDRLELQESIVGNLDWIDGIAQMEPLAALKEVQRISEARHANR